MDKPSFDGLMEGILSYKPLSVGSLFSGVGGIDLGFLNSGFSLSWANEIDKDACLTMKSNFKHSIYEGDIKDIQKLPSVDVVVGGFPCQAFSIAGYRNGLDDERGAIFFEMIRLIKQIKPKAILLENVKNLTVHNQGQTMQVILKEIEKCGYSVKYDVLNACEFSDIPQNRERVYIVGFKDLNTLEKFNFPSKIEKTLSIRDLLETNVDNCYYYKDTKYNEELEKVVTNKETCYQWRRQYVRENKSNMCPTLTANMGTGGHNVPLILDNKGIRKLTPRECFRFQGFPDSFVLPNVAKSKLYKQAGNSVSVPVIERIASAMYNALNGKMGDQLNTNR